MATDYEYIDGRFLQFRRDLAKVEVHLKALEYKVEQLEKELEKHKEHECVEEMGK
jgi:hypothetical protein